MQAWAKQIGDIALITASILGAVFFTILLVTGQHHLPVRAGARPANWACSRPSASPTRRCSSLVLAESCLLAVLGGALGLGLAWLLIARGDPTGGTPAAVLLPDRAMCSSVSG